MVFGRLIAGLRLRAQGQDDGLSIIEVILALTLFALTIVGIMTSVGSGLKLTGQSNTRQIATQVAVELTEELRGTTFSSLGMPVGTVYETAVVGNPDQNVDTGPDPDRYSVPLANPVTEDLATGSLPGGHKPTPHLVGGRSYQPYQYVTRPSATEKRITVVVVYRDPGNATMQQVVLSSIVTAGRIAFPTTSTSTTAVTIPTTTTTAPPATTTTLATCASDTTAPAVSRFDIATGTGNPTEFVNSTTVTVVVEANDSGACVPVQVRLSNNGTTWSAWETIDTTGPDAVNWVIPSGDGLKTVFGEVRDGVGNATSRNDSVTLDQTAPSPAPSPLSASSSKASGTWRVHLTWNNVTRDGSPTSWVAAYRIYRGVGTGSRNQLTDVSVIASGTGCVRTNATCTYVDPTVSKNISYTYYVVGVDGAGNQSAPTATVACIIPNGGNSGTCS